MQPDANDVIFQQYTPDLLGILQAIYSLFGGSTIDSESFAALLSKIWDVYSIIAFIISAGLLFGVIYAYIRYNQASDLEEKTIEVSERLYQEYYRGDATNNRWLDVQTHIETDNPNDWKLAIIEADVMLEEMLESAGYAGTTVGEKLKSASPQSFETLDDAWKAHKLRNDIAHGVADFVLTQRMARETITQYRRVFEEFGVI